MAFQLVILMMLPLALEGAGEATCSSGVDSSGVCIAAAKGTGLLQVNTIKKHAELVSDGKIDTMPVVVTMSVATDQQLNNTTIYENIQYLPTKFSGIWDRSNAYTLQQIPLLKGWGWGMAWSDLESQQGTFDFTDLNSALLKANQANASIYAMVFVGPDSPAWIYNKTVRVDVQADPNHPGFQQGYPNYLDPTYIALRNNMLNTLGNYLRNHVYSANVGFIQANWGCTGDTVFYKTPPVNSTYQIGPKQQTRHVRDTWVAYKAAFQDGPGRVIPVLINPEDDEDPVEEAAAIATFKGLGVKGSAYVRGHHLTGEKSYFDLHRPKFLNATSYSPVPFLFARAEHDQTWKQTLFQINVKLGFYWAIINGLTQGLSVHDVSLDALGSCYNLGYADSFEFFNLYAPQIWPHNSTNAFIALHEGLAASDQDKFPVGDTYGLGGRNLDRITKICAKYADFGCANDDTDAALKGQVYQRSSQVGYNDVGYDIWPTNYGRWLEQIDADVTSQGLFRINGTIGKSTSKYARFARGLNHGAGKTGMYFKLSDGFFAKTAPGLLSVHLIWFDSAPGSFQVKYVDQNLVEAVALDQVCAGDKQWKHAYFSMNNLSSRRNERGSDFSLVSKDSTNVIVHMIEISRVL